MSEISVDTIYGTIDDEQRKAIKDAILEINVCLSEMDSQKEQMKAIIDSCSDLTNIPKKIIRSMAKTYHNQNFDEKVTETKEFEALYEAAIRE